MRRCIEYLNDEVSGDAFGAVESETDTTYVCYNLVTISTKSSIAGNPNIIMKYLPGVILNLSEKKKTIIDKSKFVSEIVVMHYLTFTMDEGSNINEPSKFY